MRYAAPARLVGRQAVPVSAGFPASPFPPGCFQPHRSGSAGLPAPRRPDPAADQFGLLPASPFRLWPVSQPRRSQLGRFPSFTVSSSAGLPPRRSGPSGSRRAPAPRRRPPVPTPAANTGFPAFPASRGSPRIVPVPCGECISTPSASVTQEPAGIHFEFFPHPHVVHRIPPVIRTFQRLSTGFCTAHPQVTRRNSSPRRQADLRSNSMKAASTPSGPFGALPSPVPSGSMAHRSGSSRTNGTSTQPGPEPPGAERARKIRLPLRGRPAYPGYMTTRQAPKRLGYMNPASRLLAALTGGVVAG